MSLIVDTFTAARVGRTTQLVCTSCCPAAEVSVGKVQCTSPPALTGTDWGCLLI